MSPDRDFHAGMERIEGLIRQLDRSSDPAVRASVQELIQSLMDLHGAAVNRMLEIVHERGEEGAAAIDAIGRDPLTSSLLVLYGLHPETIETRVARAMEELAPVFRKSGADIGLESIEEGVVRLRIGALENPSAGGHLKQAIEDKIYERAPDVVRVEGLASLGAPGLVSIQTAGQGIALAGQSGD